MGHESHLALNGDSALEIVRWFRPQIVFLDLVLGSEYDRMRSLKAGCDEHFLKPIAQRVLERVLAAR